MKYWKHSWYAMTTPWIKNIRFKNIHFSLKKVFSSTLSVTNPLIRYEIIFIITHEKKSGAHRELTVTCWWAHCESTVFKMQSRDLAVSSPRSKCSPWQFVFSWDFHTDPVLHASSFAPFGTDFDHLVKKAICHKYKVTRIDHINPKMQLMLCSIATQFMLKTKYW